MTDKNPNNGMCIKDINFPGWLKAGLVIVGTAYIIAKVEESKSNNDGLVIGFFVFFIWMILFILLFTV